MRRPARRRTPGAAMNAVWWFISVGLFISLWELSAALGWINVLILPPPHMFIAEIQNQAQFLSPRVGDARVGANFAALAAILSTLQRVIIGVTLAFVSAVTFGGLASYFRLFRNLTMPTITLLAPIAPVAWIPLAILIFGVGNLVAIFVVFIGIFFTLTLATVTCVNNVDQVYINTARVLGANRRQVMRHVVLPAIIPNIFVILRMNFFGAWTGVLAAEMVGVNTGLGAIIMVGRSMFNARLMFLGMALIGIVGYLLDVAFAQVQKRVLWWKGTANV